MRAILVAVAVATATSARAGASWLTGFRGGVSIADFGGDDAQGAQSRTAFAGGFFAQADLWRHLGLRFEGLLVGKGASAEEGGVEGEIKIRYLELPVLIVVRAPASSAVTLQAFAGPTLGFAIGADAEVDFGVFSVSGDIGDDIADFEFGLAFGLGVGIEAGSAVLVLDARYDLGLTGIDDGLSSTGADLDLKNRAFALTAGVGFPLR